MSHRIDNFTPASFLTQATNVRQRDLSKVDLLRKIPYKIMRIPELGPLFNQPREILLENYAILARVFDGTGLINAGGVHGERRLTGDYMFGFLGATTPLSQSAWNIMAKVGSRLLFMNAEPHSSRSERLKRSQEVMESPIHYKTRAMIARNAVTDFMESLLDDLRPDKYSLPIDPPEGLDTEKRLLDHCGYRPRSVVWNRDRDDPEARAWIARIAEFVTTCRQDVRVWTESSATGKGEVNSTGAVEEGPERFTALIYNLARCHALIGGRLGIGMSDGGMVASIAMSSLPDDRRKAIGLLIGGSRQGYHGTPLKFTVPDLAAGLARSDKTARQVMEKLRILGIGRVISGRGSAPTVFELNQDYAWLCGEEFGDMVSGHC